MTGPKMSWRLWPQIVNTLEEKYTIVDWYGVCDHDYDLNSVVSFWQNYNVKHFTDQERIVIVDADPSFYQIDSTINDNLYNLFSVFNYYNIPTNFLIFIVNYPADQQIEKLAQLFNLPMPKIVTCEHLENMVGPDVPNIPKINLEKIQKHFICLNGHQRVHRVELLCLLEDQDLLKHGIVTYNFNTVQTPKTFVNKGNIDISLLGLNLRSCIPFSRMNERYAKNDRIISTYSEHYKKFVGVTKKSDLVDVDYLERERLIGSHEFKSSAFIQKVAINLVSETVMHYPYPYISEKSWMSILCQRPFIIAGSAGSLAKLHSLGFKTFSDYWDEGYDTIADTSERLCEITDLIKKITALPIAQVKELVLDMQPILEYNLKNYQENFSKTGLQNLLNQL